MKRREFLAGLTTSLAASAIQAGDPPREAILPFGYSLYGMRSLTLREGIDAAAKIGYDAVEIAVMPQWPGEPSRVSAEERRRLRDRLVELRLSLPALMENIPLDAADDVQRRYPDRLSAAADLGRDLSPNAHPLIETILGGQVGAWDRLRQGFADRLAGWARWGEKHRTVIAIKPHRFGAMNLPAHALWLLDQVKSPWIKLAYDFSHYQHRDLTVAETLKPLLPHVRFVHVKDARLENGRAQFVLPGDGGIDYVDLLTRLREGGYAGCACVEVSGMLFNQKGYEPVESAQRAYRNLEPAFARKSDAGHSACFP